MTEEAMDCKKCKARWATLLKLVGGHMVYLCPSCANEWHKHVLSKPEFTEVFLVEALIKSSNFREGDLEKLFQRRLSAELALHQIAEQWIADKAPAVDEPPSS